MRIYEAALLSASATWVLLCVGWAVHCLTTARGKDVPFQSFLRDVFEMRDIVDKLLAGLTSGSTLVLAYSVLP